MANQQYTILGAGLAGISASYHLGHNRCIVFEAKGHPGGHIHSRQFNGFTWDEGPHVSFTKHQYVKDLFAKSVAQDFLEFPVHPTNYFNGSWIPHPAQSNLWAVPQPLRTNCLEDFLATRQQAPAPVAAKDYEAWLLAAFGGAFTQHFPEAYTKKYWTLPSKELTTDWVGGRVFYPDVDVVKRGYEGPQAGSTHYITSIRYPAHGGYNKFADAMQAGLPVHFHKTVERIDLETRKIFFAGGDVHSFEQLISTLPLPQLINYCSAPVEIKEAAAALSCSELLIINFEVAHAPTRAEQWLYVYDEDFYSTRINFTDLLSPNNAPAGKCGIQVEVYFSKHRPLTESIENIKEKVAGELVQMGLVKAASDIEAAHTLWIPFANVIFDHPCKAAMDKVLNWLTAYGLYREADDLEPMTDWDAKFTVPEKLGPLVLAGRFGQWKYYWTDDCVLRGKYIAEAVQL